MEIRNFSSLKDALETVNPVDLISLLSIQDQLNLPRRVILTELINHHSQVPIYISRKNTRVKEEYFLRLTDATNIFKREFQVP